MNVFQSPSDSCLEKQQGMEKTRMDPLPSIQDAVLAEEPLAALDTAGTVRDLRYCWWGNMYKSHMGRDCTAPGCAGIVTVEKLLLF